MLKKHIRTHTNVRPFTCKYCNFSFKTKGNLTKHMKSKAHSKKCVELGIIPVPTTAEDQQMDDSKSSEDIAIAGDSDTDDGDDADDLEDEEEEELLEEGGHERKRVPSAGGYEDSTGLGLAPRAPRFSFFSTSPAPPPTPIPAGESGPASVLSTTVTTVSQLSEHEQVSRLSRLASELPAATPQEGVAPSPAPSPAPSYFQPGYGRPARGAAALLYSGETQTSKIWSIAGLTHSPPAPAPSPGRAGGPEPRLERAADILSPATESATILSYMGGTAGRAGRVVVAGPVESASLESAGLRDYLQERAAARAKQHQQAVTDSKLVIKEEVGLVETSQQERPDSAGQAGSAVKSSVGYQAYSETIPQNVTMNVKDMPAVAGPGQAVPPAPEFSIPQLGQAKADSPLRRPGLQSEAMKIRTPESINQAGGSGRGSASPASGSSSAECTSDQSPATTAAQSRQDSEKGSLISKTQEIFQVNEDGKSVCGICKKVFSKPSQLRLHVNIHYFERPFRCEACAVSFRTKGHLQKHKRSVGHFNKVNINATFGAPSTDNPRPFKCSDCMIAFRIHGHLAKHLRSKMHIMKLECIGKLPIGMYAEMERIGTNLNEIDTTDCENSLESLQVIKITDLYFDQKD